MSSCDEFNQPWPPPPATAFRLARPGTYRIYEAAAAVQPELAKSLYSSSKVCSCYQLVKFACAYSVEGWESPYGGYVYCKALQLLECMQIQYSNRGIYLRISLDFCGAQLRRGSSWFYTKYSVNLIRVIQCNYQDSSAGKNTDFLMLINTNDNYNQRQYFILLQHSGS